MSLLKPIIKEILVKEIGESNIKLLKWNIISPGKYNFIYKIKDIDETITVDFDPIRDEIEKQYYLPSKYRNIGMILNIAYQIQGIQTQYEKTDLKTLLTILSTIVDIIKNYINKYNPQALYIKPTQKELDNNSILQKQNLYNAFINKQLDQIPNYGVDTYRDGFIIIKNK